MTQHKSNSSTYKYSKLWRFSSLHVRRITLLIASIILLTACATQQRQNTFSPQLLGVPDSTWNSYDEVKRNELRANYAQMLLTRQAEDQRTQDITQEQLKATQQNESTALTTTVISTTVSPITIKFSNGSALMPPFTDWYPFTPTTTTIYAGTCQEIWLTTLDNTSKVALRACYKNKSLTLDPSRYELDKQDGTIAIPYSPLWDRGFAYHNINSDGYVKLKNTVITIKQE